MRFRETDAISGTLTSSANFLKVSWPNCFAYLLVDLTTIPPISFFNCFSFRASVFLLLDLSEERCFDLSLAVELGGGTAMAAAVAAARAMMASS